MTRIETATVDTPVGPVHLAARAGRLCAVAFDDGWEDSAHRLRVRFPDAELEPASDPAGGATALRAYLDGDLTALAALPVDTTGTPFQRRVWSALRRIPAGRTRSYGDVARAIGAPRAVRAVGTANGANPIAIVVPCHRVVRTGGHLGGYGGGLERKRWLLDHERGAM